MDFSFSPGCFVEILSPVSSVAINSIDELKTAQNKAASTVNWTVTGGVDMFLQK